MTKKRKQLLAIIITILAIIAIFIYHQLTARGAGYSWFQTDWSGNASTTALATHASNQTGWDKFYSKDDNIMASTTGELSLVSITATSTHTSDADFASGTKDQIFVSSGAVGMIKPLGVSCSADAECLNGWCRAGYCNDCSSFTYGSSTYSVVIIGTQCWMASNLDVGTLATSSSTGSSHSDVTNNGIIEKYCYENATSSCDTYGGLYDWDEAMGYVTTAGTQGICSSGWHIPTDDEFYTLENYLKDDGQTCNSGRTGYDCLSAGTNLKSGGSSGFTALLGGNRLETGSFSSLFSYAFFWSSSGGGSNSLRRTLYSLETRVYRSSLNKKRGFSVRCIKN